jgi:hypothetical protein
MKADPKKPKSIYGKGGKFIRGIPACETVRQLKKQLARLPDDLPIRGGEGIRLVWFNVGRLDDGLNGEHLGFEEPDDWDDED